MHFFELGIRALRAEARLVWAALRDWRLLATLGLFAVLLVLHLAFYALALAGIRLHRRTMPALVCLPYFFCLTNAASLGGFWRWWRRSQPVTWAQADRQVAGPAGTP